MSVATTSSVEHQLQPPGLPRGLVHDPRYRVLHEIGRGGMGVVYAALDRETGERVAVKLLASQRDGLLRFKNEFRLAARLGHPNLVALHDLVIRDDVAYFVMEYAPGIDLRRYVRAAPTKVGGRVALEKLYACVLQMLDALECLYGAGIVHRDLKPSNVIVSENGQIKLLDFGLAGAHDTPDFSQAMQAGTPSYMSPEQIEGRALGPAADLYALGVIVYELLVGEPPFVGTQRAVMHMHRHAYPVPPSDRADGVPPGLEAWLLRLLAKKPEERFASPREARRALEALGAPTAEPRWNELGSGRYAALRDLELVGRDSERALLDALLERVRDGACHMALVSGESGLGKTALAEALYGEAEDLGCLVLRGACREHEAVPYNAFDAVVDEAASAVERLLRDGRLTPAQLTEEAEDVALLGRLFPVLRELKGDAAAAPPSANPVTERGERSERKRGNAEPVATPGDRERAFAVCKRLVARVTASRPLVLLLDDLHWADEDSFALLSHLLAEPSCRGLLVLATAWPVTDEDTPFHRFLGGQRVNADGGVTLLSLGALGPDEAADVVAAATPADRPLHARTTAAILDEALGNPFLLVELTRLAVEEEVEHPTVGEVARRRLQLLADDEQALVELAAVAPGPVDADLLHASLEAHSRPLELESAGLRRLVALKILRETGARGRSLGGVRYDFYHRRLRETIKAEIPESRKRALHLRFAQALAELRPDDCEQLVCELLLGGDEAGAALHAEAAAERAMARLAHARAVELYQLALRFAGEGHARRLRVRLGQALEGTARFGEAVAPYRAGLGSNGLPLGIERTRTELRLANCLMHVGKLEESGALVERCLAALGHAPRRLRIVRLATVAWLLLRSLLNWRRAPRKLDDLETEARLWAYGLAVAHFQFTSRNLLQLEFALRYRLLGMRSPALEVRQEAHAMALILLLPFAHLGGRVQRRVEQHFARLEAQHPKMASERGRAWKPLLRALYAMVSGRPDQAIAHFDELADYAFARTGYVALQRQNALFLAGAYDRYIADLTATVQHDGAGLRPLDIARLAYIERVRGHHETARRLADDVDRIAPEEVPWTHRSLFTYQLVELKLLDGDSETAARLARALLERIRRGAVSPTTGAFESLDAVVRAFLSEALRLERLPDGSGRAQAAQLRREAARALQRVPLLSPPLFAARLAHDRALMARAEGRHRDAMRFYDEAERLSRGGVVPCFRLRLLEDLIDLTPAADRRLTDYVLEAQAMATLHGHERRKRPAPWL